MITEHVAEQWDLELDDLFVTIGHRFSRVELRRRMRDYVRGLLAPVARKNSWQLAEQAGHATPDGLQHLLAGAKWEPDDISNELQEYVAHKLGEDDGVLIIDDTGFIKKGTTSAGVQRQYSGTAGRRGCRLRPAGQGDLPGGFPQQSRGVTGRPVPGPRTRGRWCHESNRTLPWIPGSTPPAGMSVAVPLHPARGKVCATASVSLCATEICPGATS
ncbi:transposase [Streptomyces sp. NPDC001787]|uniref:transposase n=1 Tax=Streptomyces sp. NPDC001787 TaxID=3154523 RepID=UPI003326C26B